MTSFYRKAAWFFVLFLLVSTVRAQNIVLTDDLGRAVPIDTSGRRWISLAPHLTESFQAVGLESRLIAVDQYSPNTGSLAKAYRLPGLMPHQPTLFRLSPTVIWVWYTSPASRLLALERQGIPVFYSRPQRLESIPEFLEKLKPFAESALVERALAQWSQRLEVLRHRYADARIVNVFHPFSWRPLISFNHTHWLSSALKLCGAVSVTDSLSLAGPLVKPSYVQKQHVDLIILAEHESQSVLQKRWGEAVPVLAALPVITVDPDRWHRPSPRFIEGLETVCEKIDAIRGQGRP